MDTAVKTLIILDANVDSRHQLLASLQSSEIVRVLDPDRDGISQITDLLRQCHQEGFRVSLHLVGHGSPGCMTLGSADLSLEALDCYRSDWQIWAKSIETIALYGCQVAAGDAGEELLSQLHHITGASLSASSHLVGNAALGGTWDLDWTIGTPSSIPFDRTQLAAYPAVLATFTVTNTNDSGAGSLRQAMLDANANPGLDTIAFSIGTGVQTIVPLSELPIITDAVIIDGTTQPGFSGTPIIEINGSNAGDANGFAIISGGTTIKGLVINRFNTANPPVGGIGIVMFTNGGNVIQGNFIGTDVTGTIDLGNSRSGIVVQDSPNNLIGGTTAAARNVISGNGQPGIFIANVNTSGSTTGNQVQGNYIGTDITGTANLGNAFGAIEIQASGNTIGGLAPGSGNRLAFSNRGVLVSLGTGNAVLSNQIFSNVNLGIDLDYNLLGVTLNDLGDADTGANNLQNFPVLTTATTTGTTVTIDGTLNSTANTTFILQFFASTVADPSGYGEGEVFLGSQTVTTDASGNATINAVITAAVTAGQFITATATDPSNNTSEFSAAIATGVTTPTADLGVTITDGKTTVTPGSALSYTITVTNNGPNTVNSLTLSSVLPPNLTSPIFTPATGTYNTATGNWTGLNLAIGQSTTLILSGTVNAAATGNLTTTVTVAPPAGTVDGQSGNNTASYTNTILQALAGVNPAFDLIKLTDLRNDSRFAGIDGSGVGVAVIDTGVDNTHPLLAPNFKFGQDFVTGTYRGDIETHGTHVAGTMGATDRNIGVAPDAEIIGLQTFQFLQDGKLRTSSLAVNDALEWVLANYEQYNIKVVNMSLGGGVYTDPSQAGTDARIATIKKLEKAGVTVVASAGNDFVKITTENQSPSDWGVGAPGIFSSLLVGSVWRDGAVNNPTQWGSAPFLGIEDSTGGDRLNVFTQRLQAPNMIFAPGAYIQSTVPVKPDSGNPNPLDSKGGTSMAAPTVSGAVAILQEVAFEFAGRWYSVPEMVNLVRSTADTIFDGDDEDNNVPATQQSYLRLNVLQAANKIVQDAAALGGVTQDANGTLAGAYLGPILDGVRTPAPIVGRIGIDGTAIAVGNTDVDLYRFEVLSPGNVTINITSDPINPADFDSYLRLFDANGTLLTEDNDSSIGQFSQITNFSLNQGVYFAGVSGFNNNGYNPFLAGSGTAGATGNYQIAFDLTSPDANGIISGATPVNLTPGTPIVINEAIGTDNGNPVTTVDDVDLYRFDVPTDGVLRLNINAPGNTFNPVVRFFRKDGTVALSSVVNANTNFNLTLPQALTLYLGVSDASNNTYDSTVLNGRPAPATNGNYTFSLEFTSSNPNVTPPPTGAQSLITDPNGSLSLAQGLSVSALPIVNLAGTIGIDINPADGTEQVVGNNDVDFYRVNDPNGGVLELEVTSEDDPTDPNFLNAEILIFDASGNLIATTAPSSLQSNTNNPNRKTRVLVPIAANTDYFIAITGAGTDNVDPSVMGSGSPGDTGTYRLNGVLRSQTDAESVANNTIDQPGVEAIGVGEVLPGFLGMDGALVVGLDDVDLYRFIPTLTGTVIIRTLTDQAADADTVLRVFDAEGNEIAFNDDASNTTIASQVTLPVEFGRVYYIGINGYSPQAQNYNPVTGTGRAIGSSGSYSLEIAPSTLPVATVLNQLANNTFRLEGLAGTAQVQATLIGRNPRSLDELSLFTVDDDAGRINGILPEATGYLQAALQRSQVIFSNLANLPNGTEANPTRSLNLAVGSRLRFFLVKDGTADGVRSGNISTSNVIFTASSTLQVSQTGATYRLAWENTPGAGADFQDLVVTLGVVNQPQILGNALQGGQEAELIDLRSVTGSVQASITLTREAAFNNVVGFYKVQNTQGTIADPLTGKLLNPGESGYLEAAVRNRISNLDMTVTNQSTATFTSQFSGGTLLAPFLVANGTPAALLDNNPANDPAVYVPFLAANPGRVDHLRLLGDNRFGFEDLPSGGDFDYNDIVMKVSLQVV